MARSIVIGASWKMSGSLPDGCIKTTLLYLGDLNDSQHADWTKALEVFNVDSRQSETRSLFPSDRTPPPTGAPALSLRLEEYQLSHPCQYGACWLACDLESAKQAWLVLVN